MSTANIKAIQAKKDNTNQVLISRGKIMQNQIRVPSPSEESESGPLGQWMFERIQPYTYGSILEIGSGIWTISNIFIKHHTSISLSDNDANNCRLLEERFYGNNLVESIHQIDLTAEYFETKYKPLTCKFDTVLFLNFITPFPTDNSTVINAKQLVKDGGSLILIVPVFTALYEALDSGFDYWHKYNKERIIKSLPHGLNIIAMRYFNILGTFQDYIIHKETTYNKLVPMFNVENSAPSQVGLSVILVAQKIN